MQEPGNDIGDRGELKQALDAGLQDGAAAGGRLSWFVRACLVGALCGSGYLAATALLGGSIAGCGPSSGCNRVLASRWGYWLGLPVSLPGFGCYLALLILVNRMSGKRRQPLSLGLLVATTSLSLLTIGAAVWFGAIQTLLLGAWCKFCLATHLCGCLASIGLLVQLKRHHAPGQSSKGRVWLQSALAAALGLTALVAGQSAVAKRFYQVSLAGAHSAFGEDVIRLHGGKFKLDPKGLPGVGVAGATNYIVSLFDYTCIHCRALHGLLKQAQEESRGGFGVITLPVPLDAGCNPLIVITAEANTGACEYARLALAVWKARPESFAEFDEWMLASPKVPSLDATRAKAEELVGKPALETALASGWVARQLQIDVSLYQANARAVGDAHLPQLIIGDAIVHGAIDTSTELKRVLEEHLHPGPR